MNDLQPNSSYTVNAPAITPELRTWILEQVQAKVTEAALLDAMIVVGWPQVVAQQAIETTLRPSSHPAATTRPAVPEPALREGASCVQLPDRTVPVLLTMAHPRVVVFGSFLSDQECDALIALAAPQLARSLTVATRTGGEEVNADRTSDGMFFQRGAHPLVTTIEARIAALLQWPVENGEGLQVLHYRPGAQYKPHYDYFDPAEPGTERILSRGGQRVGTLVMYLNTPERGGATTFPAAQLEVVAQRGNAVFFSYPQPHPSSGTLHGGAPVLAGEKWVATKWLREQEFV